MFGFETWKKSMREAAGFEGITEEHLKRVAEEIKLFGKTRVTAQDFNRACIKCGINPGNFTDKDINRLQEILDGAE